MHWQSLGDFFTMGGHGMYVWSVLLLTVLVLVIEAFSLWQLKQNTLKRFRRVRLLASKKVNNE